MDAGRPGLLRRALPNIVAPAQAGACVTRCPPPERAPDSRSGPCLRRGDGAREGRRVQDSRSSQITLTIPCNISTLAVASASTSLVIR
jgi:hypothetical protein